MLKFELLKLIKCYFAIPALFVLLVAKIVCAPFFFTTTTFQDERSQRHYDNYQKAYGGALSTEKETSILSEKKTILNAQEAMHRLDQKLLSFAYKSDAEYVRDIQPLLPVLEKVEAFETIFKQYNDAAADTQRRYLHPYQAIALERDSLDLSAVFLFLFLGCYLFLLEEKGGMTFILRASCRSPKKLLCCKHTILCGAAILYACFSFSVAIISTTALCGSQILHYPIQSFSLYQNSPYSLTVLQLHGIFVVLRGLGHLCLAYFSAGLLLATKNIQITLVSLFSVLLLQQIAFIDSSVIYHTPIGLLRTVGYFRGNIDANSTPFVAAISIEDLLVSISVCICLLIAVVCMINKYCVSRTHVNHGMFRRKCIANLCVIVLFFGGCTRANPSQEVATGYHFTLANSYFLQQTFRQHFLLNEGNIMGFMEDNTAFEPLRSPFEKASVMSFAVWENTLYYLNKYDTGEKIHSINLDTFDETVVFERTYYPQASFFSLLKPRNTKIQSPSVGFFVDSAWIYLISASPSGISRYHMKTKETQLLVQDTIFQNNVCFNGEEIFYLNEKLHLMRYNVASGQTTLLSSKYLRTLYLTETMLYYADKDTVYAYDISTFQETPLIKTSVMGLRAFNGTLFFLDETRTLYCLPKGAAIPEKIADPWITAFEIVESQNSLLVQFFENGENRQTYFPLYGK